MARDLVEEVTGIQSERDKKIIALAKAEHHVEGELEIDDNAVISEAEDGDNGAYVQAWVWVSFDDTDIVKEAK